MKTNLEQKQWHDNGQLASRVTYKNGELNGLYEEWYGSGKLATRTNYKDGKINSLYEQWYANGQMYMRATYKGGRIDGLYEEWLPNGKLIERTMYYGKGKRKSLPTDVSLQELVKRGELDEKYLYDENEGEEVNKKLTIMETNFEQKAEQLGLLVIDTTDNGNGYPSNLRKGVIGFENYKQADDFAKEVNGEVTYFSKRYGWKVYQRGNRAWEAYEEGMEYHEDSSVYVIGVLVW